MGFEPEASPVPRRGIRCVSRLLLPCLLALWFVASAIHGGLRQSVHDAVTGIEARGQAPPGQPDARTQWLGPYYQALDEVLKRRPNRSAIAIVLRASDRDGSKAGPSPRLSESIYRLYPSKVDCYYRQGDDGYGIFWFPSAPAPPPASPPLWQHEYVLWADDIAPEPPPGYRPVFRNSEAALYERMVAMP